MQPFCCGKAQQECQEVPKGKRRPADAITIAKIASGEIADMTTEDGKNAAAVAHGS
jgi:hypothetical protein